MNITYFDMLRESQKRRKKRGEREKQGEKYMCVFSM